MGKQRSPDTKHARHGHQQETLISEIHPSMRSKLSIAFCALLVLALPIMGGCGSAGGSTETVHVVVTPVPSPHPSAGGYAYPARP